jgi:hypothetical protein
MAAGLALAPAATSASGRVADGIVLQAAGTSGTGFDPVVAISWKNAYHA